ncbi:DsbA family protein [Hyphomicrobium sp. LHD-15]|uniref:DsbA family protein n=1 Tax=Hyphomicrobium sp. LHD-15 TaxID=3072142 RepID=UPI00280E289D|nr:DsbA family protein [Hyphomicrobium sp. LHD-15]MDQ8699375.1 DsbA family protein [Hyphomicrobium sp. LHD-15]
MDVISRLDRRQVIKAGTAIAGLAMLGASFPAFAQRAQGPAEVPVDELMKAGDLPDLAIGPDNAKVTIVEYASMTCGHCMHFHTTVFPEIKKKYVDTGKVRFIFREFPLDARAFAASMLARCAGPEKALSLIDALFHTQADWAFVKTNPTPKLFEIAKQAGFTQESFDKCLTDQKLLDQLTAIHSRANETFGVNATPTFFINGKRLQAAPNIEEFDKVLEPLLAQG